MSSMNNFMEAYRAVHNPEAKEEFYAKRDSITEMNLTSLFHADLVDITEQVVAKLFETLTVNQTKELVVETFCEVPSVQEAKVDRILEAFKTVFQKVDEVAATVAREQFSQYLNHKRLDRQKAVMNSIEESQQRFHRHAVAGDVENVKNLLLTMLEKKLDAVGQEDADIDNDGDVDSSDKYLHKRRKAIGKAMGKKDKKSIKKEEVELVDEAITSEKGKAKMKAMLDARTTASGKAKKGQGDTVARIKHIGRSEREGLSGTPMTPTMAKNPAKSRTSTGTGNKAEKRAAELNREEVERLDEISQKTATKAYAASSTGEFEGQDSPRDVKRTDNLRRQIKRKFGDKAAQHADRAAHAMTFGRNSKFMKMPKKPTNEEVEQLFSKEELDRINSIVETWEE